MNKLQESLQSYLLTIRKSMMQGLNSFYRWIEKHLELILWMSFFSFCLLLTWMIYDFSQCNFVSNECEFKGCEFKSRLNFSINFVGVMGAGLISIMGALFYHGKTAIDNQTNNLVKDKELEKKLKTIIMHLSNANMNPHKLTEDNSEDHDVCIDIDVGSSKDHWTTEIAYCFHKYKIDDADPSFDTMKLGLAAFKQRFKSSRVTVIICSKKDVMVWAKTRLDKYIQVIIDGKKEKSLSRFPRILFGYDNQLDLNEYINEKRNKYSIGKAMLEFKKYDFTTTHNVCEHQLVKDVEDLIKR